MDILDMEQPHDFQAGACEVSVQIDVNPLERGGTSLKRNTIESTDTQLTYREGISEQANGHTQSEPPRKKTRRGRYEVEPDYSAMQRERARTQNGKEDKRISNACDRCKVRKLRCDSRAEGCHHCFWASLPCNHTNMMTAETLARGETESMRKKISNLEKQVQELQREIVRLQSCNTSSAVQFSKAPDGLCTPSTSLHEAHENIDLMHDSDDGIFYCTCLDGGYCFAHGVI